MQKKHKESEELAVYRQNITTHRKTKVNPEEVEATTALWVKSLKPEEGAAETDTKTSTARQLRTKEMRAAERATEASCHLQHIELRAAEIVAKVTRHCQHMEARAAKRAAEGARDCHKMKAINAERAAEMARYLQDMEIRAAEDAAESDRRFERLFMKLKTSIDLARKRTNAK